MKDKKLEAIEKVLVEIDPVKLIKMGAPDDEYSHEAVMIYEGINRYTSLDKMHKIIFDIFVNQFGGKEYADKIIGTFDSYREVAERIKKIVGD